MKFYIVTALALLFVSTYSFAREATLGDLCKAAEQTADALQDYRDTVQNDPKPKYEDVIIGLQTLSGTIDVAFGSLKVSESLSDQNGNPMTVLVETKKIKAGALAIEKLLTSVHSQRHHLIAQNLEGQLKALQSASVALINLSCVIAKR
jgi:hypothetical protein